MSDDESDMSTAALLAKLRAVRAELDTLKAKLALGSEYAVVVRAQEAEARAERAEADLAEMRERDHEALCKWIESSDRRVRAEALAAAERICRERADGRSMVEAAALLGAAQAIAAEIEGGR